jgi:hypothetical protein
MALVAFDKVCPRCYGRSLKRVERRSWMRWLPSSKHYQCKRCRSNMLMLFERVAWKLK